MKTSLETRVLWTAAAGILAFGVSFVVSGLLHRSRSEFVLAYGVAGVTFLAAYLRLSRNEPVLQLRRHWIRGSIGGVALGLLLTHGVLQQPASPVPRGGSLIWALFWFGLVYGLMDALLLNIFPVHVIYGSGPAQASRSMSRRLARSMLALLVSLLVTALYHLGFAEFRGAALKQPLLGNAIITAGYLVTGSPLTGLIAHTWMHLAAVLHGMETTVQLPPHY